MRLSVFAVSALLAVGGCATGVYTPELTEPVSNQAQFQKDVDECNAEQEQRHEAASKAHAGDSALMYGAGVLGTAVVHAKGNKQDDYFRTPGDIIDECMAARGYKVAGQ